MKDDEQYGREGGKATRAAAVYLANASSLYLPGSNLTNLLVLANNPVAGGTFATELFAPALTTAIGVGLLCRGELRCARRPARRSAPEVAASERACSRPRRPPR